MTNHANLTDQGLVDLHVELARLDIRDHNIEAGHLPELEERLENMFFAKLRTVKRPPGYPEEPKLSIDKSDDPYFYGEGELTKEDTEKLKNHERVLSAWRRKQCLSAYGNKQNDTLERHIGYWFADVFGEDIAIVGKPKTKPRNIDKYAHLRGYREKHPYLLPLLKRDKRLDVREICQDIDPKVEEGQYLIRSFIDYARKNDPCKARYKITGPHKTSDSDVILREHRK